MCIRDRLLASHTIVVLVTGCSLANGEELEHNLRLPRFMAGDERVDYGTKQLPPPYINISMRIHTKTLEDGKRSGDCWGFLITTISVILYMHSGILSDTGRMDLWASANMETKRLKAKTRRGNMRPDGTDRELR